jgi:hypothetical protein
MQQFNGLIENGMTDGRMPLGTAAVEKRGVALEVPEWISDTSSRRHHVDHAQ